MKNIIHCADAIMVYEETGELVLIERLDSGRLALPGGKLESGEVAVEAVVREVLEETGLDFTPVSELGLYDEPGRDPRGEYASTVFVGTGCGSPHDETGKTKVVFMDLDSFESWKHRLAFDHAKIIGDHLKSVYANPAH